MYRAPLFSFSSHSHFEPLPLPHQLPRVLPLSTSESPRSLLLTDLPLLLTPLATAHTQVPQIMQMRNGKEVLLEEKEKTGKKQTGKKQPGKGKEEGAKDAPNGSGFGKGAI